jgi:hypothetical protein
MIFFVLLEYGLCQRKGWVLQFVATQLYTHAVGVPPAMLGPHHLLKFPLSPEFTMEKRRKI